MPPVHLELRSLHHLPILQQSQKHMSWAQYFWGLSTLLFKQSEYLTFPNFSRKVKKPCLGWLLLVVLLCGCDTNPFSFENSKTPSIRRAEYIDRMQDEIIEIPSQEKQHLRPYPWKRKIVGNYPIINKEYFRCKGSHQNPDKHTDQGGSFVVLQDCGGIEQHSLPLRENKEFIYPILINLLNYVQSKVQKQVIITSGHRCPDHNRYNDPAPKSQYSKHMIGAEVSFYVKGLENSAESIVMLLQEYFKENSEYQGLKEYLEFKRWEKSGLDVSTQPWYNKEVFIKLYKPSEGRNFDNSHHYSYIAIQVRFDRAQNETVSYSWDKAFRSFWRW
jgi:hypothetical protein